MKDIILVKNTYYVKADSLPVDERTHVLKHGDTFTVIDSRGNIRPLGIEQHGIFHQGTRFLSRLVLELQGLYPLLLGSQVREDNDLLAVDLTNPGLVCPDGTWLPQSAVHMQRTCFVWKAVYYEKITVHSYLADMINLPLTFRFAADFVDIFEVRGITRKKRGSLEDPRIGPESLVFYYTGLDEIQRQTTITFHPQPRSVGTTTDYVLKLHPQQTSAICLTIQCGSTENEPPALPINTAFEGMKKHVVRVREGSCRVETSNEQFNDWLNASWSDLMMLVSETPQGLYPYAGVPWYSTPFGRDGIITALQTLWIYPAIARGVLAFLARHQADRIDQTRDAEPGKILHEKRRGEMANTGEIPFKLYYGSIDATPLYIILAGYYLQRTGEADFLRKLWPSIQAALHWIDTYGDMDGDGFVEYERKSRTGLNNQGWKDSDDSIFHADGSQAPSPIALSEVQAYVYEAKLQAASIAKVCKENDQAIELERQAAALRENFQKRFWCKDIGMYALALDGQKKPCLIRSSNAGHCLFSGIADQKHAQSMAEQFMTKPFFTGWGIRTVASTEIRYNPMSYHNGTVWPHDNGIIASGLARYGFKKEAVRILGGLFDTSLFMELNRLPELFCGFERIPKTGPTRYPVACLPQAWASASVYQILQACLGLCVDGQSGTIYFNQPMLPPSLQEVELKELNLPSGSADITLKKHEEDVVVNLNQKRGDFDLIIKK